MNLVKRDKKTPLSKSPIYQDNSKRRYTYLTINNLDYLTKIEKETINTRCASLIFC